MQKIINSLRWIMKQIIFATGNKAKLAQIRFVVEHFKFPVEIVSGKEIYGDKAKYEEIGDTVDKVALNGALFVAKSIGLPVITEDTDIRVDVLNGEPGIRAGEYLKNYGREGILERMKDKTNRQASICSAVGYATPGGESKLFSNLLRGTISNTERFGQFPIWVAPDKDNPWGGGYSPIFIPEGYNKTIGEISPEDAIPWSYRERNFIEVIKYILNID